MLNNETKSIISLQYVVILFTVLLIGLIIASETSAQWPPYSNGTYSIGSVYNNGFLFGSFSFPFNNPTYSNSFNSASPFISTSPFTPASYSLSGLLSRSSENYSNTSMTGGIYGQYTNAFIPSTPYNNVSPSSGSSLSALSLFPSGPSYGGLYGGLYGGPNGGLFAGLTSYGVYPSGTFPSWPQSYSAPMYSGTGVIPPPLLGLAQAGTIMGTVISPVITVTPDNSWPGAPSIIPIPHPPGYGETTPAPAPWKGEGEWQSLQISYTDSGAAKGKLILDTVDDQKVLEMENSSLFPDRGLATQFQYVPTSGDAPISFKAEFPSGYTAEFTGTANNSLCPLNVFCAFGGYFTIEGEYVIKSDLGQVVDQGTFNLKWPVYHPAPAPKPDAAIKELGSPDGGDILSLTTGPDGRIYGGTDNGSEREGCMFVYDPATRELTELGKPGYECAAMTTGTNGLIYIGGGSKFLANYSTRGYANFAVYDPAKAWNPGSGPESNPRDLGQVVAYPEDTQATPIEVHDLVTAQDGKICGGTGWGNLGPRDYYAHLFVYDPQTDKIDYLGQPIPQQGCITSLTMTSNGILCGVVQAAPVNTYKRPVGKIFTYNPADKSFTIIDPKIDPNPVDEGVLELTIGKDGIIYAAGIKDMNRIFSYDPASHAYDSKGSLGGNAKVLDMLCTDDGIIYMGSAVDGCLVQYDPTKPWAEKLYYDDLQDKPGANPRMFHNTGKVSTLTVGQNGYIYFGTLEGKLFVYTGGEQF